MKKEERIQKTGKAAKSHQTLQTRTMCWAAIGGRGAGKDENVQLQTPQRLGLVTVNIFPGQCTPRILLVSRAVTYCGIRILFGKYLKVWVCVCKFPSLLSLEFYPYAVKGHGRGPHIMQPWRSGGTRSTKSYESATVGDILRGLSDSTMIVFVVDVFLSFLWLGICLIFNCFKFLSEVSNVLVSHTSPAIIISCKNRFFSPSCVYNSTKVCCTWYDQILSGSICSENA